MNLLFGSEAPCILQNDRALLRPISILDLPYLLPYSIQEPEIWKFSLLQAGGGIEPLTEYIQLAQQDMKMQTAYVFIVFDKLTQQYAGSTRFYDIQLSQKTLQLGYTWYGKIYQGTGLNKNCKFLLLQFAFEVLQMERVEFRADNNNQKSIAAMKSIGCVVEGVLRNNGFTATGQRRDSIVLSIVKDEWFGGVKEKLRVRINEGLKG